MARDTHEELAALLRLFAEHGLQELVVEEGDLRVRLARTAPAEAPPSRAEPGRPPQARRLRPAEGPAPARRRTVAVRSPLIGTFYRSPSPDSPAFVELGDTVEEGQTVCIVEAMKVFNEIKADWRGRVVAIPAQAGQLVQAGDPLVVLEFLEEQEER